MIISRGGGKPAGESKWKDSSVTISDSLWKKGMDGGKKRSYALKKQKENGLKCLFGGSYADILAALVIVKG